MSSIRSEPNSRRRAHRVDLPMVIEIDGRACAARDWSVTGVAVEAPPGLEANRGEVLAARLMIPMHGASLALPVKLRLVAWDGKLARFAFVDLSPRDRRILRQYIELGIEGRLDNVEDMIALLAQPELPSPISDALVLADPEDEPPSCMARARGALSLVAGLLFVLVVAGTVFYNTTYRVEALGVAMGTVRPVSAGVTGVLAEMRVREGDRVEAGTPLFTLDSRELRIELARIDRELALIDRQLGQVAGGGATGVSMQAMPDAAGPTPEEEGQRRVKAGILPVPLDLLRRLETAPAIDILAPARLPEATGGDRQGTRLALAREKIRLEAARQRTALRIAARRVTAPVAGRVFRVAHRSGEPLAPAQPVVLLATDRPPLVVARLRQEDALALAPGMEAVVAVPHSGENFRARIRSIGSTAVKADFTPTMEVSLGETLITLEPLDPTVRLEPFTRVSVWIRTFDLDLLP